MNVLYNEESFINENLVAHWLILYFQKWLSSQSDDQNKHIMAPMKILGEKDTQNSMSDSVNVKVHENHEIPLQILILST